MKTNITVEQRLSETASPDELRALLSAGTMTAEELRLIESHIIVAEQLQHVKREYIPVPLKQSLYQLEAPAGTEKIIQEIRSNRRAILPFILIAFLGIALISSDIRNTAAFILQIVVLCSLFGFVFYTLFKSKILRF